MASYIDLLNATMTFQNIRLDQRGPVRQDVRSQDTSFQQVLARSIETAPVKTLTYKTDMAPAFSHAEIEDQLKFRECLKFVLIQEGEKYVADDGGKESSKFGMLQSTAKSLGYKGDVRNLSRVEAEGLYKKIWDKSEAKSLPYPMCLVHFDTFVNSPGAARKLLKNSGGNLEGYLKSREQRYTRLAGARPATFGKYLKGWKSRIHSLQNAVAEYKKANTMARAGTSDAGSDETA
jgi:hypothetical protein